MAQKELTRVLHSVIDSMGHTVAGGVVSVAVGEEVTELAFGSANLNTGQPFTTDTGWLLGSVTKVLTTTLLLRLVDRGLVQLDTPVTTYLHDFTLADGSQDRITVRMLANHTNGIDADGLMPTHVRGRDASRSYQAELAKVGTLFEPGAGIHYSNPGFVLAGRIAEEILGIPFEQAITQEVFGPCGMIDATAVQTQGFLRRTAIGAFPDGDGGWRATDLFTLPESAGGAGATPIVTVADMVAFGRTHLNGGIATTGERVLSAELVAAMQTPTCDLGLPQAPPMGLGWWLMPIAGTVAPWHGGGSPGGTSSFCILPAHDAVIVSFAAGAPASSPLNDALHNAAITHITGSPVELPFEPGPVNLTLDELAGTYEQFQIRQHVTVDGDALNVVGETMWFDDDHREYLTAYMGGADMLPPVTLEPIADRTFIPQGLPREMLSGFYGRMALTAFLPAVDGRPAGMHSRLRFTRRVT